MTTSKYLVVGPFSVGLVAATSVVAACEVAGCVSAAWVVAPPDVDCSVLLPPPSPRLATCSGSTKRPI